MGRYKGYMTWYRLKSNSKELFIKISGSDYIIEQPESYKDAVMLAEDTIDAMQECVKIMAEDNRTAVYILDMKDVSLLEINLKFFIKYITMIISEPRSVTMTRLDVKNSNAAWAYIIGIMPKDIKERMVLI